MKKLLTHLFIIVVFPLSASHLDEVVKVEYQPLVAATERLLEAMNYIGYPLVPEDMQAMQSLLENPDQKDVIRGIQTILDKYCLVAVHINPESRVKVKDGPVDKKLLQNGWTSFLVKVHNEGNVTAPLEVQSPNTEPLFHQSGYPGRHRPPVTVPEHEVPNRFLEVAIYDKQPLKEGLSGLALEYRIIQLYSREAGKKEVKFDFNVGQGTQDIGFRSETSILFDIEVPVEMEVELIDYDGTRVFGSLLIKDKFGRIYPAPSRRLAPDFFFQNQIYRESGETVLLPPGEYTVDYTRGPEYLLSTRKITVPQAKTHKESFRFERWINLEKMDWISGDVHIHAAGCAHYESPTEGVLPEDMIRQIMGEDLRVGSILSWGPSWYFQKQFFEGSTNKLSSNKHIMRYDVEVSGFPSSHAGHLSLLRLTDDDYNGVQSIEEWPSWDLPILKWAKEQGAVTGFTHSGLGLKVPGEYLPNYNMPPFNSIGANEYIMDVTHDVVDVLATVNTQPIYELNIWYHTLNCGFRTRITGETDFPCIFDSRVGIGRSYVKMKGVPVTYDNWIQGVKEGRNYVTDGMSHLIDFTVGGVPVGEKTNKGKDFSQYDIKSPQKVKVSAKVAARLEEDPETAERFGDLDTNSRSMARRNPKLEYRYLPMNEKPYWHLEKARIGDTRKIPVELIVNGHAVDRIEIDADGSIQDVKFDVLIEKSSWVALRILPSSHTNPVFVIVDDQPIRASRKSALWCIDAVDVCWDAKKDNIRESELDEARLAYDHAKMVYHKILRESLFD
ncbi:MAG: CehA/McbA family metallohydrolase [Cyclobacteriaceae bacterium]|nr:CehA/McbA family metallohydrolase [Cyclobacteriaceae bacterium]